jgi:hypothetical protein
MPTPSGPPGATPFRLAACKRRRLCQGDRISGIAPATTGPVAAGGAYPAFLYWSPLRPHRSLLLRSFPRRRSLLRPLSPLRLRRFLSSRRFPLRANFLRSRSTSGCGVDGSASTPRATGMQSALPNPGRRPSHPGVQPLPSETWKSPKSAPRKARRNLPQRNSGETPPDTPKQCHSRGIHIINTTYCGSPLTYPTDGATFCFHAVIILGPRRKRPAVPSFRFPHDDRGPLTAQPGPRAI